ncbi:acetyl-CoA hydrolase/transferase C-terminal domain-containing protein [Marinimicrobium alkaliphilum]|uniref:acetyl-CoA hydrolase/transferase C-terminal domain-containing protein n=1 Tax=Marinimicrobium alkaliphilum TaxID=2202654 RepID=UPI000DBA3642|nr:acetyl-CoA hydrolase/transferase C-terminal domain-containing protein [Marinimicrobium alkaliphilum]
MVRPDSYRDPQACVDQVIEQVGKTIVLGLPLGLGKPRHFVNALYARAQADPSLQLHIVTALSLLAPEPGESLERRFLAPFVERLYGQIPELAYARDAMDDQLPSNVTLSEFFFQAGNLKNNRNQQRHYICTNYTHALRDILDQGVNVIAQLVAPDEQGEQVSLSCNPDLTLDLLPRLRAQPYPTIAIAEFSRYLPYMGNSAARPRTDFDLFLDDPDSEYPLFPVPQTPITPQDHLIGFYASTLLQDAGTLQIGIGSLGAALVHSTLMRHRDNPRWQAVYRDLAVAQRFPVVEHCGGTGSFDAGLYGCSEMMVDGFIHLLNAGILKRRVYPDVALQEAINRGESVAQDDRQGGVVMHGGFFVGPEDFYRQLHRLSDEQHRLIDMTSINYINDLFDHPLGTQRLKVAQRQQSRFINSAMLCTLDGAAVSDGLEDGRVISGVGGQYNFVAMAHELPGARSILTLRSTRNAGGRTVSTILFSYGHCTIPRHLRDIVVTEYGIADLRGRSDEAVYLALIQVADARFQQALLEQAQAAGKVAKDFRIPDAWRRNTPETIAAQFKQAGGEHQFPRFPFGTELTDAEQQLGKTLKALKGKSATKAGKLALLWGGLTAGGPAPEHEPLLERMALTRPRGLAEQIERRLLIYGLKHL